MAYVNYWAVVASAVASMVIGSIWYGPMFGKMFMKEMGMDKWSKEKQDAMKKTMGVSYLGQFIASLIMFYVVAGYIFMIVEARRLGIRHVWVYLLLSSIVAVSVMFPLFLIARQYAISLQRSTARDTP